MNAIMAESGGYPMPPGPYCCPLCLDDPRDPVTLPCGDTNCCLECVTIYWDQLDHVGVYSCPQCRATFTPRPALRRQVPDVQSVQEPRRNPPAITAPFPHMQRDVLCDFCVGPRNKAVKSCLMCLAYYCETHVKPHYESATFKRHKLVDETGHLDRKICPQHEKGLELFCRTDQMCICVLCTVREHRGHNIISAEEERADKQVSPGEPPAGPRSGRPLLGMFDGTCCCLEERKADRTVFWGNVKSTKNTNYVLLIILTFYY